jgi:hypothetical protein
MKRNERRSSDIKKFGRAIKHGPFRKDFPDATRLHGGNRGSDHPRAPSQHPQGGAPQHHQRCGQGHDLCRREGDDADADGGLGEGAGVVGVEAQLEDRGHDQPHCGRVEAGQGAAVDLEAPVD